MAAPLELVLMWHMHQPDYRDHASCEFRRPWVYLHAIKDYTDMAGHLERHPGVRAIVNFSPVLLDQIEDYADQFEKRAPRDPLLRLLARADEPLTPDDRAYLLRQGFEANQRHMIQPFPEYKALYDAYQLLRERGDDSGAYLSDVFYDDLVTWYHLVWTGETVRRSSEVVARLMSKGERFTPEDRRELFDLLGELVRGLIGRYRKLRESGQVELTTTPDHHPLAPLLINLASAREAMPAAELPKAREYPGGTARVAEHIRLAMESHERRFGERPVGVWPAEGAVSTPLLALLDAAGCKWCASGETVIMNSLPANGVAADARAMLHQPFRAGQTPGPLIFFRSDLLSDLIGFEYAKWNGTDAAHNFVARLEEIGRSVPEGRARIVSVILDGENCWEYYDYNGYYFLEALYKTLESHPHVRTTTFRDYVVDIHSRRGDVSHSRGDASHSRGDASHSRGDASDSRGDASHSRGDGNPFVLERLTAGSWVYGNFSTWIGSPDKNRAWDLLCAAKQSFDRVMASGRVDDDHARAAYRQLAACEASDWFWWLGDYNPGPAVASFDELFRGSLANLYRLLNLPPPANLATPISHGSGHPEAGGTMRRSGEVVHGSE
jgi:alpha-amylase/alpha-mannosidase (GH57 family)